MRDTSEYENRFILSMERQLCRYFCINTILSLMCSLLFSLASKLFVTIDILFAVFLFCAILMGLFTIYFAFSFVCASVRTIKLKNKKVVPELSVCVEKHPTLFIKIGGNIVTVRSEKDSMEYRTFTDTPTYNNISVGAPVVMVDFGKIFFVQYSKCYFVTKEKSEE